MTSPEGRPTTTERPDTSPTTVAPGETVNQLIISRHHLGSDTGTMHLRPDLGVAAIRFLPDGKADIGVVNHRLVATTTSDGSEPSRLPHILTALAAEAGVRKIVAAAVMHDGSHPDGTDAYHDHADQVTQTLWRHDVVPTRIFPLTENGTDSTPRNPHQVLVDASTLVGRSFTEHGAPIVDVHPDNGRVSPSQISTLADWKEAYVESGQEGFWGKNMQLIDHFADRFQGWNLVRINTTAQAGGVAGMLHPAGRFIEEYNKE